MQKTAEPYQDAIWDLDSGESKEPRITWGSRSPHAKEQILAKRRCLGMPNHTLTWAVQKWPNHRDPVWVVDSDGPKEPCIRHGSQSPQVMGQFLGESTCPGHEQAFSSQSCRSRVDGCLLFASVSLFANCRWNAFCRWQY